MLKSLGELETTLGGLLACGLTASLLTSPTAAAISATSSSATSESSNACAGGAEDAFLTGHPGTAFLTNATTRQGEHYSFYVANEGAATSSIMRASTVAGCWDAGQEPPTSPGQGSGTRPMQDPPSRILITRTSPRRPHRPIRPLMSRIRRLDLQ